MWVRRDRLRLGGRSCRPQKCRESPEHPNLSAPDDPLHLPHSSLVPEVDRYSLRRLFFEVAQTALIFDHPATTSTMGVR